MKIKKQFRGIKTGFINSKEAIGEGVITLIRDPQITIYGYLGVGFIWLTSPFVSRYVVGVWRDVERPVNELGQTTHTPHVLLVHAGLVAFSAFYAAFISAYVNCAVSASVWEKLDNRPTSPLYGLRQVFRRFGRVSLFALLAVFFFPLAVYAQRQKLPRGIVGVIGSSFSISMVQLAPAVMQYEDGFFKTIKKSINTLGQAWHESLFIRLATFAGVLIIGGIGFLIKLVQHWLFSGETARVIGWFSSILLGVGVFIAAKLLSTVLTTTLYYKVSKHEI